MRVALARRAPRDHDRRPWQLVATPYAQAVLALRWFKERTDVDVLARDTKISIATAYRYLHEAIDVIAAHVPDLHDVLVRGLEQGWEFVYLDGTLIPTVRSSRTSDAGHDLWYSGKHHRHGGNVQVLTGPSGFPEWISPAEPGSTHDITAARQHVLPALYLSAAAGLKTLTDKGYTGAGIGILVPIKGRDPSVDNHTRNLMITALRAPAERANALLKTNLENPRTHHPRPRSNQRHHRSRTRTSSSTTAGPVRKPHLYLQSEDRH